MPKGFNYKQRAYYYFHKKRMAIKSYDISMRILEGIAAKLRPDLDPDDRCSLARKMQCAFSEFYHQTKGKILHTLFPSRPAYHYQLWDGEYVCAINCSDCRCADSCYPYSY